MYFKIRQFSLPLFELKKVQKGDFLFFKKNCFIVCVCMFNLWPRGACSSDFSASVSVETTGVERTEDGVGCGEEDNGRVVLEELVEFIDAVVGEFEHRRSRGAEPTEITVEACEVLSSSSGIIVSPAAPPH